MIHLYCIHLSAHPDLRMTVVTNQTRALLLAALH